MIKDYIAQAKSGDKFRTQAGQTVIFVRRAPEWNVAYFLRDNKEMYFVNMVTGSTLSTEDVERGCTSPGDIVEPVYDFEYDIIGWPDIQAYMNLEGFRENATLIEPNDNLGIGSSTYLVSKKWLKNL